MHRRKQAVKAEVKPMSEEKPAITCAFLSVNLNDSQGGNFLAQLVNAAASTFQQQEVWECAEQFFQKDMGLSGPLIKVHGELKPAADYLILAPHVQTQPGLLLKATHFMRQCASFACLQLQLQIGCSFVVDHTGMHQCSAYWQSCVAIWVCVLNFINNTVLCRHQVCGT